MKKKQYMKAPKRAERQSANTSQTAMLAMSQALRRVATEMNSPELQRLVGELEVKEHQAHFQNRSL